MSITFHSGQLKSQEALQISSIRQHHLRQSAPLVHQLYHYTVFSKTKKSVSKSLRENPTAEERVWSRRISFNRYS